jgi:dynein intermediate chain 1, axonemal
MTFDLGTAVGDIAWAPYSSTVFAAVTDEGPVRDFRRNRRGHIAFPPPPPPQRATCSKLLLHPVWSQVDVYDLHANKHEQLCEQKVVKKAKCTHVSFNARSPVLLVGDSQGGVTSLKLSPNLRRITPIPAPVVRKGDVQSVAPSREEVEIRKMDRLLALSDAKITIVTPIPGQAKAKRPGTAGVAGGGDEGDAGPAEASAGAVAEP